METRDSFATPQEAVEAIAAMLRAEDWAALARCYDLEGTGLARAALESGRYFVREGGAHPSGVDRYRPFAPAYRYQRHEVSGADATVYVTLEIDEGGGMVQRSVRSFRLRRVGDGWKVRLDPDAGPLVTTWLRAAMRAWVSRAQATNETVRAQQEAERIEGELRRVTGARGEVTGARTAAARRRAEAEQRMVSLATEAREQTDADRRTLAELQREIERCALEERLLGELEGRL